ncbi:hypothetical protein HMPREF1416_00538 [Helicobacter pylori GAM260ASi]|nr:hypothetical protein HMPREF1416_00538 [Helicobacter pylori GAM260ASi]
MVFNSYSAVSFNLNAFVNHFWYRFNYIYGVFFSFCFTRSLLYLIRLSYALSCVLNQKPFLRTQLL